MSEIGFVQIQLELLQGMCEIIIILQFYLSPFDCRQQENKNIIDGKQIGNGINGLHFCPVFIRKQKIKQEQVRKTIRKRFKGL